MRFLALQPNIELMKKQFIVEGEDVLLTTQHHRFIFLFPFAAQTVIVLVVAALVILFALSFQGFEQTMVAGGALFLLALYYLYQFLKAYVNWRYNFIVVSTRKVVIVEHHLFFYQNVFPIHLENISSTSFESQFLGFGHCGVLHFHLKEREGGSTKLINWTYIPKPEVVAGVVENAIALLNQKKEEGQKQGEQQEQIDAVKEKADKQIPPPDVSAAAEK